MVAKEISSHDRDERDVKVRNEPHALIKDGEIERRFAVGVVRLEIQMNEPRDIARRGE